MNSCTNVHPVYGNCAFGAGHKIGYHYAATDVVREPRVTANGARFILVTSTARHWDHNGNDVNLDENGNIICN
jgi:hypothetical protein